MTAIPGPMPHTDRWFETRQQRLGSSDAAPAIGKSRWKTALELYAEKWGTIEEFKGNKSTRRGTIFEPAVVRLWQEETQTDILQYPCPMYLDADRDWLAATPDAQIAEDRGLECKTLTVRMADQLGEDFSSDIPVEWKLQAQHQMGVLGWQQIEFAVCVDWELRRFLVDRDDQAIDDLFTLESDFVARLRAQDPPAPDFTHPSTEKLLKKLAKGRDGVAVMGTPEQWALWQRDRLWQRMEKRIEQKRKDAKARLLFSMQQHQAERLLFEDHGSQIYISETAPTVVKTFTRAGFVTLRESKLK